jgi:catechol 2,3-dioxygenase-like lactoylglutathione lyase family enzyme
MALTDLLDITLAVKDPAALEAFWMRRGMLRTGTGQLGTADRASQLRLVEADYRHVAEIRVACATPEDLAVIARRLEGLGLTPTLGDGWLTIVDPILSHTVRIEVGEAAPLTPGPKRAFNAPGMLNRPDRRSEAAIRDLVPGPRRLGHVVFGSTDPQRSVEFYVNGLGFRVSDTLPEAGATFLRCSKDHHNLLILPAPVPCMNHYALEMDDFDGIGLRGVEVVGEFPDASIYGMGRHVVGSNVFWYLLDPAGGMFEFFSDMDQITNDDRWDSEIRRDDWDPFTIASYESGTSKMDFFLPSDIDAIAAGREAAGL